MKNNILFLLISGFILVSCTKERIKIDPDHPLIGLWNYSNNQGDIQVFSRDLHFLEIHGYKFNADGTLLERMIEGFCATPPVRYTNYDGTWSPINDSIIDIFVKYWGGTEHYRLVILSATSDSLKFIAQVNN